MFPLATHFCWLAMTCNDLQIGFGWAQICMQVNRLTQVFHCYATQCRSTQVDHKSTVQYMCDIYDFLCYPSRFNSIRKFWFFELVSTCESIWPQLNTSLTSYLDNFFHATNFQKPLFANTGQLRWLKFVTAWRWKKNFLLTSNVQNLFVFGHWSRESEKELIYQKKNGVTLHLCNATNFLCRNIISHNMFEMHTCVSHDFVCFD